MVPHDDYKCRIGPSKMKKIKEKDLSSIYKQWGSSSVRPNPKLNEPGAI